jgi:hypothetical protein
VNCVRVPVLAGSFVSGSFGAGSGRGRHLPGSGFPGVTADPQTGVTAQPQAVAGSLSAPQPETKQRQVQHPQPEQENLP